MADEISDYMNQEKLRNSADGNAEVAEIWTEIENLVQWNKWYKLTLKLGQLVKHPSMSRGDALIKLYYNLIIHIQDRLWSVSLVEFGIVIAKQFTHPKEALGFLEKIKDYVQERQSKDATVLCLTAMGNIKLNDEKDMDGAWAIVLKAEAILKTMDAISSVRGRFYELSSDYHKLMGNHADYYRDTLRLLQYVELNDIPVRKRLQMAFGLCFSAILEEDVFNFGELLAHPVVESLKGTDKHWLFDLLYAINCGDVMQFESLRTIWEDQGDLYEQRTQMQQKIRLICLMEMVLKQATVNRVMTVDEISSHVQLRPDETPLLVRKALTLGLVKGSIDEVERTVHMTWVQPRVQNKEQIDVMKKKMDDWATSVAETEKLVEVTASDILG